MEVIHPIGTADEAITLAQDPALAALFGLLTANGRDEPIETSIERVLRATPGVADVGLTGPCDGATHALQLATARDEYGVLTLRVDDGRSPGTPRCSRRSPRGWPSSGSSASSRAATRSGPRC